MRPMQELRYTGWWLAGGIALVLLVVTGTLAPAASLPAAGISDKVEHFAGYFALALWFAGLVHRYRYLLVGSALVALGGLLEIGQAAMNVGRSADWLDMWANTLGVALGLALAYAGLGSWMRTVERSLRDG